ncbi:heparinase II/III-like protein [Mycobacterium sp. BK558]|nr:heparinase II/III-like protein [Mycobacterium sp. BK558]
MSRLAWYVGRAATMSPREAMWRVRRMVDTARGDGLRARTNSGMSADGESDWDARRRQFCDGNARPVLLDQGRADQVAGQYRQQVDHLIAEADRVLAGERTYFGYGRVDVGAVVDWNRDPITGYRWPAVAGSRIDHRVAPSDAKWIWELNRLQHLPVLAQAWLFTGESRYADTAFAQLDSWLDQNPIGTGISWRGAFEPGIRSISVALALQGLRNSPALTTQRYQRVVAMLDASARYCWRARSRFSSANNHLIGELSGLVAVRLLFPEVAVSEALLTRAVSALAAEAEKLILPDGAGAEQSVSYQIFAAELLAGVVVLLRLSGDRVPSELVAALDRGANYFVSVVGSEDPDPRYGDDDDSFAFRLGAEPKRSVRQHLGIVAAITGNADAARYGETTLTAAWIANALCTRTGAIGRGIGNGETPPNLYAPDGGLAVLRSGRRRVTMDVGPLGYLSTAAHGHADALAVTLSADGRDVIVDPGTGSFYGDSAVRSAHRSTRVHPTVCVDDADQSVMGGPFYWRRRARVTVHAVDLVRGIVDAEHDGYGRLEDPVVHRRWVIAPPGDPSVVVVDLVDGQSEHDVAVSWPLHPDLDLTPTCHGHLVTRDGLPVVELCYAATAHIEMEQVRGDGDSHLGWWSDRLEGRTPAWLAGVRCKATGAVAVLSLLHAGEFAMTAAPEIIGTGSTLTVRWSEQGVRRVVTIDASRPGVVLDVSSSPDMGLVSKS